MKTDSLKQYVFDLNQQYKTGIAREHAYRPALKVLMQSLLPKMVVTNEPAHIDCGAPDYIVSREKDHLPVFFIEAKDLNDTDLDGKAKSGHKEQFDRYKQARSASDPRTYLQCLKDAGYATSINYVDNCMRVIEQYNLTQYDGGEPMYTNSSLVTYVDLSPGNYGPRSHAIDTITIHHMAGNLSVETCGKLFHKKKGNSNYGIGSDGRIALYVEEKNGAWTSSNKTNDMSAITIEVANNSGAPNWTISQQALNSLLLLCADICRRNNIKALVWSANKSDRINHKNGCNMTMHKDFAATACPGPFIESIEGLIAIAVNQMLLQSPYTLIGYDYAPVFDPVYYANRYPDLRVAFGDNSQALWDHFVSFGMTELRQASDEFDPVYYKSMYADLQQAYGDDNPMYYFHYVAAGKAEGRKAHA